MADSKMCSLKKGPIPKMALLPKISLNNIESHLWLSSLRLKPRDTVNIDIRTNHKTAQYKGETMHTESMYLEPINKDKMVLIDGLWVGYMPVL